MGQPVQGGVRASRVAGTVVVTLLSALCLAGAVALALAARFMMCGMFGCSGGGFGRTTDPPLTLALVVAAGVALATPLLVYAVWRRRARLAVAFVPAAVVAVLGVGFVVGSDWRGCPRGLTPEACQEERGH